MNIVANDHVDIHVTVAFELIHKTQGFLILYMCLVIFAESIVLL